MSPVLLVWFTVNVATLVMSAFAIQSANHDALAVKALNGEPRRVAVEGARQQEYIRFTKAALLLAVSVVPLIDGRAATIQLSPGIVMLTLVAILIWTGAYVSWRTRRRLDDLVRK